MYITNDLYAISLSFLRLALTLFCCPKMQQNGDRRNFSFSAPEKGKFMKPEIDPALRETDDDLILRAKSGDDAAKTLLFEHYTPLIASLAYRYSTGRPEEDRQDLSQEAAIAFFHALDEFDPARKIAFGYFAKICISNRLIGYLRKQTANPTEGALPFEEAGILGTDDPTRHIREYESYIALCNAIQGLLSENENRIWNLFISGYTASEIAKKTNCDKKAVENALARARRKIKNHLPH